MDPDNKGGIKRTTNFTKSEENHLLQLIKKYGHILENKRTDSASNQSKNEAWLKVTREFNSCGTTYRSLQVLKNKYLNMKKKTLKSFAEEKRDTYLTGGGPPVPWHETETDRDIREILGFRVTGLKSQFDDDAEGLSKDNNRPSIGMEQLDKEQVTVITEESDDNNEYEIEDTKFCGEKEYDADPSTSAATSSNAKDWSKSSTALIRTPVSKRLQVNNPSDTRKRDNTLRTKLSNWAKVKQDYVSVQQQCHLDEYKQKLKHNEERHKQELEHKRKIHEQKMKMMEEEHDIKMSILHLERQCLVNKVAK